MHPDDVLGPRLRSLADALTDDGPAVSVIERRGKFRRYRRRGGVVAMACLVVLGGLALAVGDKEDSGEFKVIDDDTDTPTTTTLVSAPEPFGIGAGGPYWIAVDSDAHSRLFVTSWEAGFLRLDERGGPAGFPTRAADVDGIFPDEWWDLVEDAGAYDLGTAVAAIDDAGFGDELRAVVAEAAESGIDAYKYLKQTLPPALQTSPDGVIWTPLGPVDSLFHEIDDVVSDGEKVVIFSAAGNELKLASSTDLVEWEIEVVDSHDWLRGAFMTESVGLTPVPSGWIFGVVAHLGTPVSPRGIESVYLHIDREREVTRLAQPPEAPVLAVRAGIGAVVGADPGTGEIFLLNTDAWEPWGTFPAADWRDLWVVGDQIVSLAGDADGVLQLWRSPVEDASWQPVDLAPLNVDSLAGAKFSSIADLEGGLVVTTDSSAEGQASRTIATFNGIEWLDLAALDATPIEDGAIARNGDLLIAPIDDEWFSISLP